MSALFQETRKFRGMYLCALFLVSSEVYAEETIKMYEPRSAYTCKVANTVQTEPEPETGEGGVVSYCLQKYRHHTEKISRSVVKRQCD